MNWTQEKPKEAGFYWAQGTFGIKMSKGQITEKNTTAIVLVSHNLQDVYWLSDQPKSNVSEWDYFYGPLEPPSGLLNLDAIPE